MQQLQNIEAIEKRLWKAADTLRANSELASNEYFMPVMGLIFLRHAYSRYLNTKVEIEKTLPSRGGKTRALTKEDFSGRGAIYLNEKAQFDNIVSLSDADDRAEAIISAMESIEKDYTGLQGQLPKQEYRDDIFHHCSASSANLQIVDYISWAVFRKYERSDDSYYQKISQYLIDEEVMTKDRKENHY